MKVLLNLTTQHKMNEMKTKQTHICPPCMGFLLINPLRKLFHDPAQMLKPYLRPGMKVLDYGSALGYFSLPMAQYVGDSGKVICIDLQQILLDKLMKRAQKAGLEDRIEPVHTSNTKVINNYTGQIEFALLFAVAHEVPDQQVLFSQLYKLMAVNAQLLFAEPRGHVSEEAFENSMRIAELAGFKVKSSSKISHSRSCILVK
jgi:2-polyprenyl-3-methyl-5-hydroxy-6-metoxy-1,4-benzoquinol methylase